MDNLFVEFGKLCNFAAISTPRTVLLGLGEGGGSSLIYNIQERRLHALCLWLSETSQISITAKIKATVDVRGM